MRVLNKKHWPYPVMVKDDTIFTEAQDWCKEMFPGRDRWCYAVHGFVHFRDEADAMFFKLRWEQ